MLIKTSTPGLQGASAYQTWLAAGNTGTQLQFLASLGGESAYQLWLGQGNTGTVSQFLASLVGENGNTIWTVSGFPAGQLGVNGDFALDPNAQILYGPKAAGSWPAGASFKGTSGSGAKWVPGTPHDGAIATRARMFDGYIGGMFQTNSRSIHNARSDSTGTTTLGLDLSMFFYNIIGPINGEVGFGDNATCRVSLEYPIGTVLGWFTLNGNATFTLLDACITSTDKMTVAIPDGAEFAIIEHRIYGPNAVGVGACGFQSLNIVNTDAGDCFEYAASGLTDRTGTAGAFNSTTATLCSRPICIYGDMTSPSCALIGDSRVAGLGDDGTTSLYVGELERSVGPKRAFMNLGFIGEQLQGLQAYIVLDGSSMVPTGTGYGMRGNLIRKRATHIFCNYGVNDIYNATNGASAQVILYWMSQLRDMFPAQWFYQDTIPGETYANQPTEASSVGGGLTMLNQINNNLMSGFANNDGTFDVASVLQNPRNLGVWSSSTYVIPDGIHYSNIGAAAIAASGVIQVP